LINNVEKDVHGCKRPTYEFKSSAWRRSSPLSFSTTSAIFERMSKTPPAPAAAAPEVKTGDVVLAKVKGFSAWPAVVRSTRVVLPLQLTMSVLFSPIRHKTIKTRVETAFVSSRAPPYPLQHCRSWTRGICHPRSKQRSPKAQVITVFGLFLPESCEWTTTHVAPYRH